MTNPPKLIGLIAILVVASSGSVAFAALSKKPDAAQPQTQQTTSTTKEAEAAQTPTEPTTTPAPATPPTPVVTPSQTTPKSTASSSGTNGGGSTAPPTPVPSPAPAPITYTYKNGSYTTPSSYGTPGGSENITVTLTITNDIITSTTIVNGASHGDAAQYQQQFSGGYQPYVVGKALANLSLSRVAGASLTTNAFNNALQTIRNQAKS